MLTIRPEQNARLFEDVFERWMDAHLRRFFPSLCARRADADLLAFIRAGIGKARRHGFLEPAAVSGFIDLSLVLGDAFDTDPALPWAAGVLSDPDPATAGGRLESLRHFAHEFLSTGTVTTSVFARPNATPPDDGPDRDDGASAAGETDT